MKKTDLQAIKGLDIKELEARAALFNKEVADLVLSVTDKTSKGKDVKLVFKKRKDLAQVLTILRQKQLLEEFQPKADRPLDEKEAKP